MMCHNDNPMAIAPSDAPLLQQSQRGCDCSTMSVNSMHLGRLLGKLTRRIKATDFFSEANTVSSAKCLSNDNRCEPSVMDGTISSTCSLDGGQRDGKPTVSFGSVEVREYGRLLVEHPLCSDGLALGLDWKHSRQSQVMHIDLYERIRISQGRSITPLQKLSTYDRKVLLMRVGGYREKTLWNVFRNHNEANSETESGRDDDSIGYD